MLAKIAAIVPEDLRPVIDDPAVGTPPARHRDDDPIDIAPLRTWCRLAIGYVDETVAVSERVIHPFMVGHVAAVRVVMAWCALRHDVRIFRTDWLTTVAFLDERYPERSVTLRRLWLASMRDKRAVVPFSGR